MGASRYLVGVLLALAVGLVVYAIAHRLMLRRMPALAATVEGFAGWLLVLAIGQWLLLLAVAVGLLRRLPLYQRHWDAAGNGEIVGEIAVRVLVVGFVLWATVTMMRKSRHYPRLLRLELAGMVVLPALGGVWLADETDVFVTEPKLWIAAALRFAVTGVGAALGLVYVRHSLRLRNTFVR